MTHDQDEPNWFTPNDFDAPLRRSPPVVRRDHPRGITEFVHSGAPAYERPAAEHGFLADVLGFYLPFLLLSGAAGVAFWVWLFGLPRLPFLL